jgi:ATP-dependent exoDNAse (exonuclease V) alpha subunit
MELNKKQKYIVDYAVDWYNNSSKQVMQYSGSAGTGKSFTLNCIIDALRLKRHRIAPMSFIGAAAIVMRLKGLYNAKTIHSWLFNPVKNYRDDKNNDYFDRPISEIGFEPKPLVDIDLIIVDEAGAVPFWLKHHIESRGIKIIACGDLDQLPPVGDQPAYLYDGDVLILDELMRQSKYSGIVHLAHRAKHGLPIHKGVYNGVLVIDDDDLTNDMISLSDIIICGKNKTRETMNKRVREDIL